MTVNSLLPANELLRVTALHDCGVLDTSREESFDELTRLLALVCHAPIAIVSFIDSHRQWNKSEVGIELGEVPRSQSLCAHTILSERGLVVEDCSQDARFADSALVRGYPGVRFYAGAPIHTAEGLAVGAVAIMDTRPRVLTPAALAALHTLARQAATNLALRRTVLDLQQQHSRTEFALRQSESFYHSLVESLPQNIFRKNLEGRFTFANSKFCSTINRPSSQVIGKTDADLFEADLAAKYRADDLEVSRDRKVVDTIEKHQSPEGLLYVHVVKTPLFDSEGIVVGIQGMFWDETERYKAQAALEHERDLLRALMENVPDRIYFKDTRSRFIAMSAAFAQGIGLPSAEAGIGKTDADIFTPDHAEAALKDEQQILQTGQPIIGKVERETWADGRESWCLTTKMPLCNREGVIRGTFGISRDITELKKVEKELGEARDVALESARLKSEFLANMSHEIRTPMNAIIGMTGLLLDTELETDQRDFAETIRLSADSLLSIINDILDFSKIEAGKLAIDVIDFDLNELTEGSADLLAERAQSKNIELAAWVHDEVPRHLRGDPGRLRQILTNLLGNAVKFTEKGEVILNVSLVGTTFDGATVRFTVRDTGIGIAPEAQGLIFEAFTQADGSMTRRYGGTGLGLAITKQLVELMQGRVGFTSELGQGSTFWFEVPFGYADKIKPRTVRPVDPSLEGCHVLIVDDNATNREILQRQTASWRMRNDCAAGAEEAIDLMRAAVRAGDPFKLVLLDMQMPVTDGITLANIIKKEPALASAQLIMLTSLGYLPSERLWREVGIAAYLVKPVKQTKLFDVIVQLLRETSSPTAPALVERVELLPPPAKAPILVRPKILLVEDNPVNQKVALRQLAKLGYEVEAANNGDEAVRAIEKFLYAVVLMDCQMPVLDGYKATGRIREMQAASPFRWTHRPYIIAMTANALAGDRETCLKAGMDDYISKPVHIDELEAALMRGVNAMESSSAPKHATLPNVNAPSVDPLALDNLRALRCDGEPDPLAELVELFLADTPARLGQMRAGVQKTDAHTLEAGAHSLKGSASNLGALTMASACSRIMEHARKGEFAAASKLLVGVEAEFAKVKAVLLDEMQR